MKILGILGSPHKNGGSAQLLHAAMKAAYLEGCETEIMCVYDGEIKSCIGCINDGEPNCRFPCIFDDFGKILLEKIYHSDGIIFATPTYWFTISSPLKALIERITSLEHMITYGEQSYVENKVVSAIAVGADGGVVSTISYILTVFNGMGAIIPPWAMAYSHQAKKAMYDDKALMDAINVGRLTAKTVKLIKGYKETIKYEYDKNLLEEIRKELIKILTL
jgi:multimeric flavodoxin WrbA